MEPGAILRLFVALACPIGMGLAIWMMSKQMGGQQGHSMPGDHAQASSVERLAAFRAQQQALEAEIAEVARLAELEAKRQSPLAGARSGSSTQEEIGASMKPSTTN